jgi:spore germination protein
MRSLGLSAVLMLAFAVPSHAWRMSAWVPTWDANAVPLMQSHAGKLHEANPGWYTIAADGSVTKNWGAEDLNLRAALSGTQLIPTIKNHINGSFNGAIVATVIGTAAGREVHAEALTTLVVAQAFDGIDIDYERVPTTSRADFTAFINLLASKLHGAGKQLSVTVYAKKADSENWNGPGSQDWVAIGRAADSVKIMAYDYHWNGSAAGPLTPLDWLDKVATYAGQTIPRGKAIMGLPWYGYDWLGTTASTVTYAQAMELARTKNATIRRDEASGEATFTYEGRTVFFNDETAYRTKVELITTRHPAIGGFAHWRVGAEDAGLWNLVGQLRNVGGGTSAMRPAAGNFTIDAPQAVELVAGTEGFAKLAVASAAVSAEMIDAFSGTLSFDAPTASPSKSTTLTVTAARWVQPGAYRILVKMTSGAIVREQMMVVYVNPAPVARRRSAGR